VAQAVVGLSKSALYRLMAETDWDAAAVSRQRIRDMVQQTVGGDGMLVVDDSAFPRKGTKTVGVTHQYCGVLGKRANCQVVVTAEHTDIACTCVDPHHCWPVLGRLYLPESWCQDEKRRSKMRQSRQEAQIPDQVTSQTKPEIALDLIDQAKAAGVPFTYVGADSGYSDNPNFLDGLDSRQLGCIVAVARDFGVRLPKEVAEAATRPLPPKKKEGRPRTYPHPVQLAPLHRADAIIADQPDSGWQTGGAAKPPITWRMGSEGPMTKQFIAVRVQRSHGRVTGPAGWLMGERPLPGHEGEHKYYWSNLPVEDAAKPPDIPLACLAERAHHRRPGIERSYQDGKGHTGLGAYPARLRHSFHRHLAIEMLVLSWLILQQPPPATTDRRCGEATIVVDDEPAVTPDQPPFPLRPRTLPQCGADPAPGLRIPLGRAGMLARPDRSGRHLSPCWSASPT